MSATAEHQSASTVIDLTEEDDNEQVYQAPVAGPSRTSANNNRVIYVDDNDDDLVYVGEQHLHLPQQPHANGNDGGAAGYINRRVDPNIIFSRSASAQAGPSNLTIRDEPPLRTTRSGQRPVRPAPGTRQGSAAAGNRVQAYVRPRQQVPYEPPPLPPPALRNAAGPRGGRRPNRAGGGGGWMGVANHIHNMVDHLLGFGWGAGDDDPELGLPEALWGLPAEEPWVQVWNRNPASVKRTVKAYSVRKSHPNYTKKMVGFSRDIVAPDEVTDEQKNAKAAYEALMQTKAKQEAEEKALLEHQTLKLSDKAKGKQRALDSDLELPSLHLKAEAKAEELDYASSTSSSLSMFDPSVSSGSTLATTASMHRRRSSSDSPLPTPPITIATKAPTRTVLAPLCASCLTPLYINQPTKSRPYLLKCSHIVCLPCVEAAKTRNIEDKKAKERRESFQVAGLGDIYEELVPTYGERELNKLKNRSRSASKGVMPVPNKSSRNKGKGKGRKAASEGQSNSKKRKAEDEEDELEEGEIGSAPSTRRRTIREGQLPHSDIPVPSALITGSSSRHTRRSAISNRNLQESSDSEDEKKDSEDRSYDPDRPEEDVETMYTKNKNKGKSTGGQSNSHGVKRGKTDDRDDISSFGPLTFSQKQEKLVPTDQKWLSCPIVGCKGDQTDLTAAIGSLDGVWEMFV